MRLDALWLPVKGFSCTGYVQVLPSALLMPTPRPSDEIISIHAIVKPLTRETYEATLPRVGDVHILQIGSGENCEIRDECLAHFHASIEVQKFAVYITNHDSSAVGTFLNGVCVRGRATLRNGDEIRCGELIIDISFEHPVLDDEVLEEAPKKDDLCPKCREPWTRNPPPCTSQSHWSAYVHHLEKEKELLKESVVRIEKSRDELLARLSEPCSGCGGDEGLTYCKLCIEKRDARIAQLLKYLRGGVQGRALEAKLMKLFQENEGEDDTPE